MILGMILISNSFGGIDSLSNATAIKISNKFFKIQIAANILLLFWFIKSKYNWQLMLINIMALIFLYFVSFLFVFVTIN
jgi:hypothetical protein